MTTPSFNGIRYCKLLLLLRDGFVGQSVFFMLKYFGMKILSVTKGSVAEELGVRAGEELISFDGFPVFDFLDYDYYNSCENFTMRVRGKEEIVDYEIEKYEDEDLGLELSREIPVRSCCNNCVFCFVDQLPEEELRSTLRVKDDDYRHSFIFGNYVTLTNVSESEIDRIIRLGLSPLYVSVHTSNEELRRKILRTKRETPSILSRLEKLSRGGIKIHAQIVYCPGINDDVDSTIRDIEPYTQSLAVVPVGLTRNCNPELKKVDSASADAVLSVVEKWQKELLVRRGTRFVFAADELYLAAGKELPSFEDYEDFAQIENGIGLIAAFKHEFDAAMESYENGDVGELSIATGESAAPLITECALKVQKKFGGKINVYKIRNDFFGSTVTVAGLVVGRDIFNQLSGKPLGSRLVLPKVMLREFGDVFLDGTTVSELSEKLGVKVQIIQPDGESFVKALIRA